MSPLASKREELSTKQRRLQAIFAEAKTDNASVIDLSQVTSIAGSNEEKRREIKRLNTELDELAQDVELLAAQESTKRLGDRLDTPIGGYPGIGGTGDSFGSLFTKSVAYTGRSRSAAGPVAELNINPRSLFETKATMTTSAGWAPQAIRSGVVVPSALRPVQILDLLPQGETQQANVVYMEETTATNAAVETSEGAAYAADTFVFTERTSNVRKIASFLPITDEQLDDVPQVQQYIDNRLIFFLRQRLDLQVLTGNGTPPNLTGLLNVAGIQTQAKGADPGTDAIFKAIVKVQITGRAFPSGIILHPTDWQNIRLLRTAEGVYILGSPADVSPTRLWGLPVAVCDSGSIGTAVVADFQNFTSLTWRRNVEVQVGYINDDFQKGLKSLRADMRAAFVVYRPTAICTVSGL